VEIYPNPAKSGTTTLQVLGAPTGSAVSVKILTLNFRKVQQETISLPLGGKISLALKDQWGTPLSNGLYYLLVTLGTKTLTLKLLILQ